VRGFTPFAGKHTSGLASRAAARPVSHCINAVSIGREEIRRLRINKQNQLFDWLKKLFKGRIHSQPSFHANSQDSNERLYSISSLQNNISAYFKIDMESPEKMSDRWIKEVPTGNGGEPVRVNESTLIRTKVAITVLVNYYKSTEQAAWKIYFQQDSYVLNFFAYLKKREQSKNLNRLYKIDMIKWEAFRLFTWGRPKAPVKYVDAKDIKRFQDTVWKFDWSSTEMFFTLNIEANLYKNS
jgi:hypothetical protein